MNKIKSILFSSLIILSIICFGCKESSNEEAQSTQIETIKKEDNSITSQDIKTIEYTEYVFSERSKKFTSNWIFYVELNEKINVLKEGDFSFFKDNSDNIVNLLNEFKTEVQFSFNIPDILVRLSVLETAIYKLEDFLKYNYPKEDILSVIKEILVAHSNLIFQINKKTEKDAQNISRPL